MWEPGPLALLPHFLLALVEDYVKIALYAFTAVVEKIH